MLSYNYLNCKTDCDNDIHAGISDADAVAFQENLYGNPTK